MIQTVKTTWKKDSLFESTNPGGTLFLNDGSESDVTAYSPKALMLSSLAGCTGLDIISLLKKMRVEVQGFSIDIEANLTEEHPKFYDKVTLIYNFSGTDFKKDKIEKAVALSAEKYCGVMDMFRKFATLDLKINYIEL
ncbi:OsmC family protein [Flavobacteriaceae bacterium F08102]|nr:OsmC family protein [Flavobacteriaceae bacterium F08102]